MAYELSLSQFLNESGAPKNTCVNCEVYKWKLAEGKITLSYTLHRVQGLLLLRQGVPGGALEENPQTELQEVGAAEANTLQHNLFARIPGSAHH